MIVSSAPGKLMVMGEHAVLYGHPCLVAAISARATATLTPRNDTQVIVRSALGELVCDLSDIVVREPFAFVLQAIVDVNPGIGLELNLECEFPADVGLGSSSAITVATVGGLLALTHGAVVDKDHAFATALSVVRSVQGVGSGADLAAATYGGLLQYSVSGGVVKRLPPIPLTTVYSGSKEKTAVVIEKVRSAMDAEPVVFDARFKAMGELVDEAASACAAGDLAKLGNLMDANQTLMEAIGVSSPTLGAIVADLRAEPGIYGAKISGSGLGDCVIGLGTVGQNFPYDPIPVVVDGGGLLLDVD